MNNRIKNLPRVSLVATLVASAISLGSHAASFTAVNIPSNAVSAPVKHTGFDKSKRLIEQQFPTYYIVQLEDAPLATYTGGVKGIAPTHRSLNKEDKLNLQSVQATAYAQHLGQRQAEFVSVLSSKFPQVQVKRNLQVVMNGLIVSSFDDNGLKSELQKLPGVKQVFEHELYYAAMDSSNTLINSPEVWQKAGGQDKAGEGIKVAIIDGGIRSEHPMFASNGHTRPAGLPTDDYCGTVDPTFCNDKLVLARYYTPTFAVHADEQISPLDYGGHGTHVAGTAVGNKVSTTYENVDVSFSGVAPGATLMVYKALFQTPGGTGSGSNVMLVAALEDAIADGADVINNSWGGSAGANPASSPYTAIFAAAEEAGVVMVSAAGNDGPGAQTIGCPACSEAGITVANSQTGRSFGNELSASGIEGIPALRGTGVSVTEDITGPLLPSSVVNAANTEACSPFDAGSVTGAIVLLPRGTCTFTEKSNNAKAGGAAGVIVYNNQPGVISMSLEGETIPTLSILQDDGNAILAAWKDGDTATIHKTAALFNAAAVDVIAELSSRGPNGDSSFLKPDIAAPGTDILSAYAPRGGEYNAISGTSMASPHVAGAAALVRQLRPELDAYQIKSVLMTSSNPDMKKQDLVTVATPFDRGAGRLDIAAAVNTAISFDKASVASSGCVISCTFERTVTNLLAEDGEWQGTVEFVNDSVTGSLDNSTLTLEAEQSANFTLTVNTTFADAGWQFGQLVWKDTSGKYPDAHLPIAVMAARSDNNQIVSTLTTSGEIVAGQPFTLRSVAGDAGDGTRPVSFNIRIPEGTELNKDSVTINATPNRVSQTGFSISPNGNVMSWAGSINSAPAVTTLNPTTAFPYAGLTVADLPIPFNSFCPAGCDEETFGLNLAAINSYFIWNGERVTAVRVSDNGFITAGAQTLTNAWNNQNLPSPTPPNNILAPLWSDFDIGGANGGDVLYNIVSDATDDWLVVEWENVKEYATTTDIAYTFSVWIKLGTDEVYFNYGNVPGALPASSTVGFENIAGTVGVSRYYNGTGTAPLTGQALQPRLTPVQPATVEINYELVSSTFGASQNTTSQVLQDESVVIDLSDKVTTSNKSAISHVTLRASTASYDAVQPLVINADGEVTLKVVTEPENGTLVAQTTGEGNSAVTEPFSYVYTPKAGFYGEDSFTYQLEDEGENKTNTATVTITVEKSNEAPVAAATGPSGIIATGTTVTLSAAGSSDPDGDTLTYSWVQTKGAQVSLTGANTATLSFVAPVLSAQNTMTFVVTVSDGTLTDTATVDVVIDKQHHKDSKKWYEGSFSALMALLALPFALLRRRKA